MKTLLHKIQNLLMKLRLQPIRVLCFHQVADQFDPTNTWEDDFLTTEVFKQRITALQEEGYTFITLPEASDHLEKETCRKKKYAVLTMDDASNCIIDLMPWLAQRNIPITLFLPYSFITREQSDHKCGISLTESQLKELTETYPSLVTIANHGYNHLRATMVSLDDYLTDIEKGENILANYPVKMPFYAYPGGHHTPASDMLVHKMGLTPVYCDGRMNYKGNYVIHREILK